MKRFADREVLETAIMRLIQAVESGVKQGFQKFQYSGFPHVIQLTKLKSPLAGVEQRSSGNLLRIPQN